VLTFSRIVRHGQYLLIKAYADVGSHTSTIIDQIQLGNVPATIDYVEYIRNNMYIYRDAYQTFPAHHREWFSQLLGRKIRRLFEMEEKSNWKAAWDLYIEAKLNLLQGPGEPMCHDQNALAYHDTIDEALFDISGLHAMEIHERTNFVRKA
jgi:hypothetical protein